MLAPERYWRDQFGRMVCTVKTPQGDINVRRGDKFNKDAYLWEVMEFWPTGMLCKLYFGEEGCLLDYVDVAIAVNEYALYEFYIG